MPSTKATQEFVPIKEVRDGVVVLKDGSLRMILMASTLNFALKSEDEQNGIIMQYQNFLNSLDFSIQFFIESRKRDINPYLNLLLAAEKEQTNELLRIQTREYISFIRELVKARNIVEKTFYVVIPYSTSVVASDDGFLSGFKNLFGGSKDDKQQDVKFEESKLQLQQRVDVVQQGLVRTGVRAQPLTTEETIELFYRLFNPGELEKETFSGENGLKLN